MAAKATTGMIKDFVQYLPDMDIAFNIHDEPRVMVPHEDLARLVTIAKDKALPAAFKTNHQRINGPLGHKTSVVGSVSRRSRRHDSTTLRINRLGQIRGFHVLPIAQLERWTRLCPIISHLMPLATLGSYTTRPPSLISVCHHRSRNLRLLRPTECIQHRA
jgi:hypothetical protein